MLLTLLNVRKASASKVNMILVPDNINGVGTIYILTHLQQFSCLQSSLQLQAPVQLPIQVPKTQLELMNQYQKEHISPICNTNGASTTLQACLKAKQLYNTNINAWVKEQMGN